MNGIYVKHICIDTDYSGKLYTATLFTDDQDKAIHSIPDIFKSVFGSDNTYIYHILSRNPDKTHFVGVRVRSATNKVYFVEGYLQGEGGIMFHYEEYCPTYEGYGYL